MADPLLYGLTITMRSEKSPEMARNKPFYGVAITLGLISVVLTACTAVTGPDRRFIPVGEEPESAVLDPSIGVTWTPVEAGWIKCAVKYDGVSVCWQVVDSVGVR